MLLEHFLYLELSFVIVISIFYVAYKQNKDMFHPIVFLSMVHIVTYIVVPIILLVNIEDLETSYIFSNYSFLENLDKQIIYSTLSLVLIAVSFNLYQSNNFIFRKKIHFINKKRAIIIFTILSIVSLSAYVFWVELLGGIYNVIENINQRNKLLVGQGNKGYGFVFYIMNLLVILPVIYYSWFSEKLNIKNKSSVKLVLFTVFIFFILLLLGGRGRAMLPIILIIVAYNYYENKIRMKSFLKITFIIFLIISVVGVLRGLNVMEGGFSYDKLYIALERLNISHIFLHFSKAQALTIMFKEYETIDSYLGFTHIPLAGLSTILSKFGMEVVHSSGSLIGYHLFGEFGRSSWPMPLFGEMYMSFGPLGVILGSIVFGVFTKKLYTYLQLNINNKNTIILYSFMFYYYIYSVYSGGFTILFAFDIFFIFAVLFLATKFTNKYNKVVS